ncbi:hypothetical protein IU449_28525 [Nocardia higoensis]|uniref:Uncharacterized protein n=1 Tax=Nocardia higoensis TaxID=228599 RepID=A0ABS0DJ06_9NOCA|nr:hypothetical protein [Nocardia higoensis]MBF6358446.1 hypothetical protein [Nocardia higoensis]
MSNREEWTSRDTAECVGMLLLTAGALTACTGNLSFDRLASYAQTAGDLAMPVAAGVGGALIAIGVLMIAVRILRVAMLAAAHAFWVYRRRWARVVDDLGLTERQGEKIAVPRIVSVVRHGDEDTVTVRMLPGQTAEQWHARSAALAAEFGAVSARVGFGAVPHRDVVIVFNRRPVPQRPMLALPAPQPHPLPLFLPQEQPQVVPMPLPGQQQRTPGEQVAVRLSGLRLQIVWARVCPQRENEGRSLPLRQRFGVRGGIVWATTTATVPARTWCSSRWQQAVA